MKYAPLLAWMCLSAAAATVTALAQAPAAPRTGGDAAAACAALARLTFEGSTSVTGATLVSSGSLVVENDTTLTGLPPFCRVQGVSRPSPESDIRFEVWLPIPANWNRRFLSSGEGGFVGSLNYTRRGLDGGLDEIVRRGYATASTDTGHRASDTWWAVGHPERVKDYLHRAKRLVTVAAKGIIAAYYGSGPERSYLNSCSNGGRQALMEVQRYPEDFDGVVVGAPWNFQSHSNAGFIWNAQALAAAGAAIPAAKLPAITAAAVAACDKKDGLADGVIADPPSCAFDPAVLTCKGSETDGCLTAPQVQAVKKIYEGPRNPRTGERIFPGFAIGSESGWGDMGRARLGVGYFGNLVFEDPEWDFRTLDFDTEVEMADVKIGRFGNAIGVDYAAAKQRGVKIIQYHGWDDQTLQPAYSPEYYDRVAAANGGVDATQDFYRLYMVPGMAHCYFGTGASSFGGVGQQITPVRDAQHDIQTALEQWVERGVPPTRLVATKFADDKPGTRTVKLTRPLCLYPTIPRYNGSGDPNDQASFSCVPR
ncbi:MAG: tannase/feruloyl esterase family alpha/beta hydrolase [Vicinamibacterales bacterium]